MYSFNKHKLIHKIVIIPSIILATLSTQALSETLKGRVFEDTNRNGKYDKNVDMALSNVSVSLTDDTGNITHLLTNANGIYKDKNITVGTVKVDINESTLPGINPIQVFGKNPTKITVKAGQTNWVGKVGYTFDQLTATVCGYLFHDINSNGAFNTGEALANVSVDIGRYNYTYDTVSTNTEGLYCASGIPVGVFYYIQVDEESLITSIGDQNIDGGIPQYIPSEVNVIFVNQPNYATPITVNTAPPS